MYHHKPCVPSFRSAPSRGVFCLNIPFSHFFESFLIADLRYVIQFLFCLLDRHCHIFCHIPYGKYRQCRLFIAKRKNAQQFRNSRDRFGCWFRNVFGLERSAEHFQYLGGKFLDTERRTVENIIDLVPCIIGRRKTIPHRTHKVWRQALRPERYPLFCPPQRKLWPCVLFSISP